MERRLFQVGLSLVGIHWVLYALPYLAGDETLGPRLGHGCRGLAVIALSPLLGWILFRRRPAGDRPRDGLLPAALGIYGAFLLTLGAGHSHGPWDATTEITAGAIMVLASGWRVHRRPPAAPLRVSPPVVFVAGLMVWAVRDAVGTIDFFVGWPGRVIIPQLVLSLVIVLGRRSILTGLLGGACRIPTTLPPVAVLWGLAIRLCGVLLLLREAEPQLYSLVPPDSFADAGRLVDWWRLAVALVLLVEGPALGRIWAGVRKR